ncbi:MAG TPA: hypothetical protein VGN16_00970 [Acidobacteriaceae bacterium]|jgi:hypothetical protein
MRDATGDPMSQVSDTTVKAAVAGKPQASPEAQEEQRLIRRMQMMMGMVMQVIAQDGSMTVDDASQMVADAREAALAMFPGKELAYDLIWKPRFQRLMRERFRLV